MWQEYCQILHIWIPSVILLCISELNHVLNITNLLVDQNLRRDCAIENIFLWNIFYYMEYYSVILFRTKFFCSDYALYHNETNVESVYFSYSSLFSMLMLSPPEVNLFHSVIHFKLTLIGFFQREYLKDIRRNVCLVISALF